MTATVWLVCHVRGHASALITRLAYTTDTCRSSIVARGGCLQAHLARFSNNLQACTLKKKERSLNYNITDLIVHGVEC